MIKKIRGYTKRWNDDFTWYIYFLRLASYALTAFFFAVSLGNRKKTKSLNRTSNYFRLQRIQLVAKHNKPLDDDFKKRFLRGDRYDFNGIFLPYIDNTIMMRYVYADVLKIYVEKNDNYHYTIVDEIDKIVPEGSYCYIGPNNEDITVKEGDIVIDAGAWIGDFSAYASKKGAHAYAFEPSPSTIKLLEKTIEYNKGNGGTITIAPYGLGEKEEELEFVENTMDENTGGNTFNIKEGEGTTKLKITTLDSWVKKNNIPKVDFIKSDIEGYERHLLRGATNVLREHAPILSICTYHFPEDKHLLKEIILSANPDYTIIQRKMKLFAFVPTKKHLY